MPRPVLHVATSIEAGHLNSVLWLDTPLGEKGAKPTTIKHLILACAKRAQFDKVNPTN